MIHVILFLLVFIGGFQLNAQEKPETQSPIIFIYDASGSMWGQMQGKTKMEIASEVLSTAINKLPQNQNIGLVAYGHRVKGDCKDVETLVSMDNNSKSKITTALKKIKPLGMTPLAYSATQVIDGLRTSKKKATIILVTDGIESCNGNICDVISAAKKEGIDFKLHIIGFGLKDGEKEQLICAAKAGDGQYYDAADAGALGEVLNEATSETIDQPKGNVTVYTVKNGIAIDALVNAYDIVNKRLPISVRTYRDTASFYLPPSKYNFEVTPLEGTDVKMITVSDIESYDDKIIHKTISFDGGKFRLTTTNNGKDWDCIIKVIDQNSKVVSTFRTYNAPKEAEVNPGVYKISIQALTGMKGLDTYTEIENVKIEAGEITPISYHFKTGEFQIYTNGGNENIDAMVTINEVKSGKNVAGSRTYDRGAKFILNPGTYEVKASPLGNYKDRKAQIFTIVVNEEMSITKTITF